MKTIPIAKPLIGKAEKKSVLAVLESGMLTQGPKVMAFEETFANDCGVKHAIATSSGTTALHAALLAHNIGPGDEVITTPFTFIATANSILYTGAKPVFVDIDPVTFNIDPKQIEAAITPHTKAIMPVHLFGLMADMHLIMGLAQSYNLLVIEDACQAHGAMYHGKQAGSFGTGCFSFYPTKNITSAEGGMITTNDKAIAKRCKAIRQHGTRRQYYHDELGFNFRMTDVHAAIGLAQLRKLKMFNFTRNANARYLSQQLKGVVIPIVPEGYHHVFHQYTIRVPGGRRDAALEGLRERGIGANVYYPITIHKQQLYAARGYSGTFPEAERASREVLSLPVHPALSYNDMYTIVKAVNELCR